jgi:hypothetical protein
VGWAPLLVAAGAFAALCVAVLVRAPELLEPDDYAYRASLVALAQGHLTLSESQYQALLAQLGDGGGPGIAQWVRASGGAWVSEKNPGYPFVALPFQVLGALRLAPLVYGALGCVGLFVGGRRWLGPWGAAYAVVLFCSSGAALTFAWRATMPTFTDASLVAAGAGALLWAALATQRTVRRRITVGVLGFLALEAALLVRYTNVVILLVAIVAVLATFRAARLPVRALLWWFGSVLLCGVVVLVFDQIVYGAALTTGYTSGVITFSLAAFAPNLRQMPVHLVRAMPMLLLALAAVGWMAVRFMRSDHVEGERRSAYRRDAVVGCALAAGWIGIWAVYLCYDWTVQQSVDLGSTVHVVRFYLPALGLVALLGAWFLAQLPRWSAAVVLVVVVVLGAWDYPQLVASGQGAPGGGFGRPPEGGPAQGPGPGSAPGGMPGFPPPDNGSGPPGAGAVQQP